ncbi:MAG TPA: radical SAM protein, partial [Thermoanaerobaculia bacterium]|nr:radical SAM protein [Thermoanaerobaculia bacterium]
MSFERLLLRTWSENRLFSVLVELTYRCNLDCFFCYNDLGLRGRPLSLTQYYEFFADLRDLEVLNLTLTGGEPLAHPEFLRLGARARELGFVVRIKSNGHALRGTMARRIREEIDPFLIEVSLHGATAAVHDRQTREAGSFDRLLANLG